MCLHLPQHQREVGCAGRGDNRLSILANASLALPGKTAIYSEP